MGGGVWSETFEQEYGRMDKLQDKKWGNIMSCLEIDLPLMNP